MANEVIKNTVSYTVASGYGLVAKAHVQQILDHIPGLYIHTTKSDTSSVYDVILTRADFNFGLRVHNSSSTLYIKLLAYGGDGVFSTTEHSIVSKQVSAFGASTTFECVRIGENYTHIKITQSGNTLQFTLAALTSRYDNSVRYGICNGGTSILAFYFTEGENVWSTSAGTIQGLSDCAPDGMAVLFPVYLFSQGLFLGNPLVGGMPVYSVASEFAGTTGKTYEIGEQKFYCISDNGGKNCYYVKL